MSAALLYSQKKFKKSLNSSRHKKPIFDAFEVLEGEIKKLDFMTQINLYSATTQFLESLIQEPEDSINPLEIFHLRCQGILGSKYESLHNIGLALGVIAISLAVIVTGSAIGLGIGIILGLWQTPIMFLASILAAELPAVCVIASSATAGIGAGLLSGLMFFKEPSLKTALNHCMETVKESYFSENQDEEPLKEDLRELKVN